MARYTPRFGLSYFGGGIPGNLVEDGAKFTQLDPQILDAVLHALEEHDHSGGTRLGDPGDSPVLVGDVEPSGGELLAGKTYFYSYTFVDRYNMETAHSPELDIDTPPPIDVPISPSLTSQAAAIVVNDFSTTAGSKTAYSTDAGFTAFDVGRTVLITGAGADGTNLTTKITQLVDAATVQLEHAPATTRNQVRATIYRGELANVYTQYALTSIVTVAVPATETTPATTEEQETPLSVPVGITPEAHGVVTVTLPEIPEGATHFGIWRKTINEGGYTKIATVGPQANWLDYGVVKADPCACDPEKMPPAINRTNGTNQVTVSVALMDQHILNDPAQGAIAWRLYRTEISDTYPARSLVAQIPRNIDGTWDFTYTDVGDDLQFGRPPIESTTINPSQPLPVHSGELPVLPDADLPEYMLWLTPDNNLWVLRGAATDETQAWARVAAQVADGSIQNRHVADNAAIDMAKIALDPLITRVEALEAESDTDAEAVHYRGQWQQGPAYQANDLVRHDSAWYISPNGQPAAPTGYTQAFDVDGPVPAAPGLDFMGNTWVAETGVGRLDSGVQPLLWGYPMLFDVAGYDQSFSVRLAGDPAQASMLYAGVTNDRTAGYAVLQQDRAITWYFFVDGIPTTLGSTTLTEAAVPDMTGALLGFSLDETAPGTFAIRSTVNDVEVFSETSSPAFTPGLWVGFGADGTVARYDDFVVAPSGTGAFDPAHWDVLVPQPADIASLETRLAAVEARAADALHYRGAFTLGADYVVNDLAVEGGTLYRSIVEQLDVAAFDPAAWEIFPPPAA